MVKRLIIFLLVLAALIAGYLFFVLKWSYSSGERAGWVQKFSHKGWLCKTWEGELALVSMPGAAAEKFFFTVHDDGVAREIERAMGKRVSLHYEEKVGLPTSCFGETRHFVNKVTLAEDIPLAPGLNVPQQPRTTPQPMPQQGQAAPTMAPPAPMPPPAPAQAPGQAQVTPSPMPPSGQPGELVRPPVITLPPNTAPGQAQGQVPGQVQGQMPPPPQPGTRP